MAIRYRNALVAGACWLGLPLGALAVDIVGSTDATLEWSPAAGPVAGYYVIVSRNAGPAQVEAISLDTLETVSGTFGETLVVQVSAFSADGVAGPLSAPSEPIRFAAAGGDGGGDGGGVPLPGGDEPPDSGGDPGSDLGGTRVARDFDGDGLADLVVKNGTTLKIWVLEAAHVAGEILLPLAPENADLVGVGDYDGNRTSDLLWEHRTTHELELWLLDGGVVAKTAMLDRSSLAFPEAWRVGGSADFDGDGRDDVLLFSGQSGDAEVWTFDGSGAVASRTRIAGHRGEWSPEVIDGAVPGSAGVVWYDEIEHVLELASPGTTAQVLGEMGVGWRVLGAANLDGAGAAELLVTHAGAGDVQAWSLDAGELHDVTEAQGVHARGALASPGDYDGDGREDLAWSDSASGVVTLRLGSPPVEALLDRTLPSGAMVISGASGSDLGAELRDRFCPSDLNGDGIANSGDVRFIRGCLSRAAIDECAPADLSGDGVVNSSDLQLFLERFAATTCQ